MDLVELKKLSFKQIIPYIIIFLLLFRNTSARNARHRLPNTNPNSENNDIVVEINSKRSSNTPAYEVTMHDHHSISDSNMQDERTAKRAGYFTPLHSEIPMSYQSEPNLQADIADTLVEDQPIIMPLTNNEGRHKSRCGARKACAIREESQALRLERVKAKILQELKLDKPPNISRSQMPPRSILDEMIRRIDGSDSQNNGLHEKMLDGRNRRKVFTRAQPRKYT